MRSLYKFHGGVHPPQHKEESSRLPIGATALPARLVVPLRQHLGSAARPAVKAGDRVLKGQLIAQADGFISAAVHAPTSGTVTAFETHAVPHPSGLPDLCAIIDADGADRWIERRPMDYRNADPAAVRERLRDSGIVGLGGAVFPTHVKLDPGTPGRIRTLVVNGAECEPYITSDDVLMRERAGEIVEGIRIMTHLLRPEEVVIGIEDNKPAAIAAMEAACQGSGFEVAAVPTLYPGGGEKQLIKVLTGREVPSGGRPLAIGTVCSNVGTAYTVHRAVNHGEPVISRVVTVTGNVRQPRNFEVPIGTPIGELVALAGGAGEDTTHYIIGGPMMGFDLLNLQAPVVKAVNCVIAASPALFPARPPAMPCIRCSRCAQACPADLQPQELFWFAQSRNFEKARGYHLADCIECGCCDYVCPSHIPLVSYFRFAKGELATRDRERKAAELAKERFELKQARIEAEKREKAERQAQKVAAAKAAKAAGGEAEQAEAERKQALIAAALERANAKKAALAAEKAAAAEGAAPPASGGKEAEGP